MWEVKQHRRTRLSRISAAVQLTLICGSKFVEIWLTRSNSCKVVPFIFGGFFVVALHAQLTPGRGPLPTSAPQINEKKLWFHLRGHFKAIGDRLSTPGKERLTLNGTLTRGTGGSASSNPIRVTTEITGKVRIEQPRGQG